jgi:opacity protein-like surface antigen
MFSFRSRWHENFLRRVLPVFGVMLCVCLLSRSQSGPAALTSTQSLWVGADFTNMQVGFPYQSNWRMSGIGTFALYNWNHAIGIQVEANFLRFNSFYNENQMSFLAGPRYTFLHSPKWRPYAQFSVGDVRTRYPFEIGTGNSFALAPAGGLDYNLTPRWAIHAQYEYQFLLNSPNFTDEPHFGMRPNGINLGISYRLFRPKQ